MEPIQALSVLDGRYKEATGRLWEIFSEYGLIRYRVFVEIQWILFLANELRVFSLDAASAGAIKEIAEAFDVSQAHEVKTIEARTNHDVKAVEYYIKQKLRAMGLGAIEEWVHFACTSEDINNTAYALMLTSGRNYVQDLLKDLLNKIEQMARAYQSVPMMSRTHGQPASPTTMGKEMVNFAWRLRYESEQLRQITIMAKFNGATGNFNAHFFVYPDIDWMKASRQFIGEYLHLEPLLLTTQINPHHSVAQILHGMTRLAATIIDFNRDMWGYIALGYFKQRLKPGEVGSSTMPHKVNPIDFENGEGNMGMAAAMMEHMAVKLLHSRFQRDLTDSTVLRNLGALFGYFVIGLKNTLKGLEKLDLDEARLSEDLAHNPQLLAEPIQTVMRVFGEDKPYEKLKDLTRGTTMSKEALNAFVTGLTRVPDPIKDKIKQLTPAAYIGLAQRLVEEYMNKYSDPRQET